jgi:hypothetical protein
LEFQPNATRIGRTFISPSYLETQPFSFSIRALRSELVRAASGNVVVFAKTVNHYFVAAWPSEDVSSPQAGLGGPDSVRPSRRTVGVDTATSPHAGSIMIPFCDCFVVVVSISWIDDPMVKTPEHLA